jgi:plastocyanin
MRTHSWVRRTGSATIVLSTLLLANCGNGVPATQVRTGGNPSVKPTVAAAGPAVMDTEVISVPQTDLFVPYIAVAEAGDTVTWVNNDTMLHTVVTGPTNGVIDPVQFQLVLPAGQHAEITLRQPGIYYYYCGAHTALNSQGRAAAFSSVRPYPLAMDGILYVRGPGMSGLSSATVTLMQNNALTPWITVLNPGATLTWLNHTGQREDLRTTPGYGGLTPVPLAVTVPSGGSSSYTFTTPGVYDYYATAGATLDPTWLRPTARLGVPGYPVPMEGIVVVLNG